MMAELTGMDISNASMYDGSTATAEAVLMAVASAKKARKVLVSETVDPKILAVIRTYAHFHGVDIEMVKATDGATDKADLDSKLADGGVAGVLVQQPNYFGVVEDYTGFADATHAAKALFIMNSVAADLAVLRTPGEWGPTSPWATDRAWACQCRSEDLTWATCAAARSSCARCRDALSA